MAAHGGFGGQEAISLGEAHPTALPPWAQKALQRLEVPPSTLHPIVSTLPNGLTLIVQSEDVSDTVSVYGHIRNRPETEEPQGQEGVAQVLDRLLTYGSERLDRVAFQQALDAIGAREHAGTDFSVQGLGEHFERALELLADNELHPALPDAAMEVIRGQVALGIAARNASPGFLTQRSLRAALFPPDDPSLRMATPETVRALTPAAVRAYYASVFRPDLTTIVVIGKVTSAAARAAIDRYFGAWSADGSAPVIDLPPVPPNGPGTVAVPDASRVQDRVVLAHSLALTRSDPDYYALQLGNAVLGGSFYSTRLSVDLRKNSGLVYSVQSLLQAGRTRSVYLVEYASDPDNVVKAANMVAREITAMQNAPAGADELTRGKACLLRQLPLSESGVEQIAHGLLARSDLGLALDEPTAAARRYIALDAAAVQDPWWRHAVIYEIYPRSFQDSNGDGIGDLNGITQRLDYLQALGVDAIWIAPMYPSPQVDFGYDISDYQNVDPQYGSLADFDHLVAEAGKRHIRVLLDMVLNHPSDQPPWFLEAARSRDSARHDFYCWNDGKPGPAGQRLPPNNWVSLFGGSRSEEHTSELQSPCNPVCR